MLYYQLIGVSDFIGIIEELDVQTVEDILFIGRKSDFFALSNLGRLKSNETNVPHKMSSCLNSIDYLISQVRPNRLAFAKGRYQRIKRLQTAEKLQTIATKRN